MPSYQPVIKNGGAIFYLSLLDAAAAGTFRVAPTLAAGDFKVSVDGAALANMTTLPTVTPAGGALVKFTLSAAETNGDNISVLCVDQTAPKEWVDAFVRIQTAVGQFDTIQSDLDNIQTRLPAALVGGRMDSSVGAVAASAITAAAIATDAIGSAQLAATAVTEIQTGLATAAALATVQADTDDIQARLPAALVGGKMESNVGSMTTDVISAAALATTAVTEIQTGLATATALATAQTDLDNIQTRLPAALVGGRMDSNVGTFTAAAITTAAFTAGAIDANAIATDAIGSAELAATAVTKIQTGLSTAASITALQADTDDIQARLPAALVGGKMESNVGTVTTGAITAAAIAADAIGASELAADAVAEIADAVWDELLSGHVTAGSAGAALIAAGVVSDPWVTALPGAYGAGTAGNIIGNRVDAAVSTRASAAQVTLVGNDVDDIQARLPTALVGGKMYSHVGALDNGVIVAATFQAGAIDANAIATDAIGAAELSAGAVTKIQTGLATGASLVTAQGDLTAIRAKTDANLDATVSSRLAPTTAGRTLDVSATGEAGLDWANIGSPLTSVSLNATGINSVNIVGEVAVLSPGAIDNVAMGPNSISASALSAGAVNEIVDAVWEELLTDHISVPDSAGWVVNESIRVNVEGIATTTGAILDDTDVIQTKLPVALVDGRMDSSVGAVAVTTNLGFSVPAIGRGTAAVGGTVISLPTSVFAPSVGSVDQFVGRVVLFDADTATVGLRGCARPISASTLASLPTLTVDTLPTLPAAGDTFSVV